MPCYDSRDHDSGVFEREEARLATRAACDMLAVLRRRGTLGEVSPETADWVMKHEAIDRARSAAIQEQLARATLKEQALKRLSQDERRALGL